MNQNYGPDYYIRIITADGEINPTNVFSIQTHKDIYSDTGSFQIELNYDQHFYDKALQNTVTYSQNSAFFRIKPMDYVEIYMARKPNPQGFGIYDEDGYFISSFTESDELDISQRIMNPDLVLCGFIDGVQNSYTLSENATNNRIIIRGQCLAKFLAKHHLFLNFPYDQLYIKKTTGQIALLGLRPNEAIDLVLTEYLIGILTNKKVKDANLSLVNKAGGTTRYVKKMEKSASHFVVWNDLEKRQTNGEYQQFTQIIHNSEPSFRYIYWGTNLDSAKTAKVTDTSPQKGYYDWGRMEYIESTNRNILNITMDSPVLNILKQSAQLPFNEFFIDEVGNIVMRKALDAWDYTIGSIDNQKDKLIKDWVEISEEDIISWNFDISDDELKTLVQSVPAASLFGTMPITVGAVGVAPVTQEIIKYFMDTDAKKIKEYNDSLKSKSSTKNIKVNIDDEKKKLADTLAKIQKKQSLHLDMYDLSTQDGLLKFWARFGIRPETINDLYSDSFSKFYESAWSLFQRYCNYWWKGTFIVKGDSKYKIGQKCIIRNFANDKNGVIRDAHFYIHTVSQRFVWGENWVTEIGFTRGEIDGTTISQNSQVQQIISQDPKTNAQKIEIVSKKK